MELERKVLELLKSRRFAGIPHLAFTAWLQRGTLPP
jgi:hypothetical protein